MYLMERACHSYLHRSSSSAVPVVALVTCCCVERQQKHVHVASWLIVSAVHLHKELAFMHRSIVKLVELCSSINMCSLQMVCFCIICGTCMVAGSGPVATC
jgi:hypothetical protein